MVRVRACCEQMAAATPATRFRVFASLVTKQPLCHPLRDVTLAQLRRTGRTAGRGQGARHPATASLRRRRAAAMARRYRRRAHAPASVRRCATACAATSSTDCVASMTRKRCGFGLCAGEVTPHAHARRNGRARVRCDPGRLLQGQVPPACALATDRDANVEQQGHRRCDADDAAFQFCDESSLPARVRRLGRRSWNR